MWTLYVLAKEPENGFMHVGYTENIKATVQFYQSLSVGSEPQKLYYVEQSEIKDEVVQRFELFSMAPQAEIRALVKQVNPNLVEYVIGVNIVL